MVRFFHHAIVAVLVFIAVFGLGHFQLVWAIPTTPNAPAACAPPANARTPCNDIHDWEATWSGRGAADIACATNCGTVTWTYVGGSCGNAAAGTSVTPNCTDCQLLDNQVQRTITSHQLTTWETVACGASWFGCIGCGGACFAACTFTGPGAAACYFTACLVIAGLCCCGAHRLCSPCDVEGAPNVITSPIGSPQCN